MQTIETDQQYLNSSLRLCRNLRSLAKTECHLLSKYWHHLSTSTMKGRKRSFVRLHAWISRLALMIPWRCWYSSFLRMTKEKRRRVTIWVKWWWLTLGSTVNITKKKMTILSLNKSLRKVKSSNLMALKIWTSIMMVGECNSQKTTLNHLIESTWSNHSSSQVKAMVSLNLYLYRRVKMSSNRAH